MLRPPHGLPRHDELNQTYGASPLPSPVRWAHLSETTLRILAAPGRARDPRRGHRPIRLHRRPCDDQAVQLLRIRHHPKQHHHDGRLFRVGLLHRQPQDAGRKPQAAWLIFLRGIATTIIVLVGLVYNALLAGASLAGSFDLAWSSNILHTIIPIYALVDWLLFADRTKLPYTKLWVALIYPVVVPKSRPRR